MSRGEIKWCKPETGDELTEPEIKQKIRDEVIKKYRYIRKIRTKEERKEIIKKWGKNGAKMDYREYQLARCRKWNLENKEYHNALCKKWDDENKGYKSAYYQAHKGRLLEEKTTSKQERSN